MSADPSEGRERARPPKVIYLQWCGADKGDVSAEELATAPPHGEVTWCADKQFDTDEKYVLAGSLEQERDELRAQHRKILLAIAANDLTTFKHGQKRRDGLKPSEAEEPGSIWNTPKEIAENALKHMALEDLARVHKGDS